MIFLMGVSQLLRFLQAKWKPQKITNMLMMLELVRILVAPSNPNANANQLAMNKQGTLETILRLTLQDNKLPDKVRYVTARQSKVGMRACFSCNVSASNDNVNGQSICKCILCPRLGATETS
jgi:hypothetical protein